MMSEGKRQMPPAIDPVVAAAHELKAPLTLIAHIAGYAEHDIASMSPAEQQQALGRIRLSAERTLRLVQGLTVGQQVVQQGQLGLGFELETLNAVQLCEEVVDETLPFARAQAQQICLQGARRPQLIIGNRELMRSVLFNLIDNALKHNLPDTAVTLGITRRAAMVRVQVGDNGPGLRRAELKRLSRTIGREAQPFHNRAGSSGLGLYIAGQMTQAMGGRLGLGRAPAGGARFYVDLLHSQQLTLL